jgi:hypothetical protein
LLIGAAERRRLSEAAAVLFQLETAARYYLPELADSYRSLAADLTRLSADASVELLPRSAE